MGPKHQHPIPERLASMGRSFLAALTIVVAPTLVWADGADSHPGEGAAGKSAVQPADKMPPITAELKNEKQKGSFAIGYTMGMTLRKQIGAETLDLSAFLRGMQQSLEGEKASLSAIEQQRALKTFIAVVQRQQMKKATEALEANKKRGEDFLAANAKKEGVKTLPSGLQYLVLKEGTGKKPTLSDVVEIDYHGTLIDGSVFDSSVDRGKPMTHPVSGFIPGWKEALPMMKEGAKWRIFVPSKLAYGQKGAGPAIGPNETLVFEIELLKVK
jgi:FKBP-type peptidyl-prolyl cis-trans isomerase FklB